MLDIALINHRLEAQREEFPGLTNKVYLNFGGQGPLPRAALAAIIETHEFLQQQGPFSLRVNSWVQQKTELLRKTIAEELGATPETIVLTENVTAGCNIAIWGIDWQKGDRILLSDCEHPGIIAIIQEVARRFGVEIATCPLLDTLNQGDAVAVIAQHLTPNTRLVVFSHLLWNTGQVLPLAEIVKVCHDYAFGKYPVQVLVDAAQSVGCLPLNLTDLEADFYAFTGHKWWCGPAGVGGLYIRPEAFASLHPTFIGWRGVNLDEKGKIIGWKDDAKRFEIGTSAYPQYEGLRAAIAVHQQWGTAAQRYQQICQLSSYLWHELSQVVGIDCLKKSPTEAGLVSFRVNSHLCGQKLVQELERQGFFLRTLSNPDCIRACVHYLTLPSEIEQLLAAIKIWLK